MSAPIFYLFAGPNGAGKSTLYQALVRQGAIDSHAEFVNADVHESMHLQSIKDPLKRSLAARDWADARRKILLMQKESFVSETVFSHASKIALVEEAKTQGFQVLLFVVALDDPSRLFIRQ